ncbi:hypothetical protein Hanom_Chr17g01569111 [Helianthus anomalus]
MGVIIQQYVLNDIAEGWKPMGCGGPPLYDGITWKGNKSVDQNFGTHFVF